MSVAASPSEPAQLVAANALAGIRSRGGVALTFKREAEGRTRLDDLHESGGFRAKFPRTHGHLEAVLINTGGGLLGGDRVAFSVSAAAGASAQVTTQSAERVYRSLGPDCLIDITLNLAARARLHWLPQETILFDAARLTRAISVNMADDATLLMVEATVFGRAAMSETMQSGSLRDAWRIWRGGALVYADTIRMSANIDGALQHAAIGNGANAMATVLYLAPDVADRLAGTRAAVETCRGRIGLSSWNDMLVGRLLANSADALKADLGRLMTYLSGHALPRVWGLS